MDLQQETPLLPSARSSFTGLPASRGWWSQVGAKFWAGLPAGTGVGLLIGAALVELELMTLQRKAWVSVTGIVLAFAGQALAWRAVGREKDKQQNR